MFEKLKNVFSSIKKSLSTKTLNEKIIDEVFDEYETQLIEGDISLDIVEELRRSLKDKLIGVKVEKKEIESFIENSLRSVLADMLLEPERDLLQLVNEKRTNVREPYVVVFLGINGTGKTTTIAKLAYLLKNNGYRVLLAAADTYRAGAIEQLELHAKRLGLKVISQRYGADAAAVARDAILHARSNRYDVVLIDTAGRMQTNRNLLEELDKIVRVTKPDMSVFVGDALSGHDIVNQVETFMRKPGFDTSILTKVDADVKGGSIINVAWASKKPIIYLGTGQKYDDLIPFSKSWVINKLLS